jgi:hypothetical protein
MAKIKTPSASNHHTKPRGLHRRAFDKVYWPYIPVVIAVSLLLGIGMNSGNLEAYVRHPGGRVLSYANSMTISSLLADTNAAREANGAGDLGLNQQLDAAAQANADDMAARNYWSHYTPDGNPPWVWVTAQGYSYQKLGQNLATGFSDEQSTIDGWMNSPPHRENLLDPSFKDVGFGFANNPNYTAAGGGPMTIIVAFYGNPQVLAASTPSPAPAAAQPMAKPPAASEAPASQPSTNDQTQPAVQSQAPSSKQAATTQTPKANITSPIKQSRLDLALSNSKAAPAATSVSILLALGIFVFWASRHLIALKRFALQGERYAVRHPLTDIFVLLIAALLFILSQTAGLIQ